MAERGSNAAVRWGAGIAALAIVGVVLYLSSGNGTKAAAGADDPNAWTMYGKDYGNTRYSPLSDINTSNVSKLNLAWAHSMGTLFSQESTPIVIGDTLYVTSSVGPRFVYALDATSGAQKWTHEFEIPKNVKQYGCCGQVNRGAAFSNGKLFIGRLDGKLTALDAKTGEEIWTKTVVDYKQGSVITSPPLIVKNLVITGFGGGEYGARGYITAFKQDTGEIAWKTWTVPGAGEPGSETWKGDSWQHGGGVAWLIGSYDPKLNIIYYGTSNPGPWNASVRGTGTSDYGKFTNLYTAATLAMDADSGKILWHIQSTPHDAWDYDGVNEAVLADVEIKGRKVPALFKADRNGFFYVANRKTGELISAEPYIFLNWATGVDLKTGKPKEVVEKRPRVGFEAKNICPNLVGGKNWQPMAFNPDTGLVYITANNVCMDMEDTEVSYRRGMFYLGKEFPTHPAPGGFGGELLAWDPVNQKEVWSVKEKFPFNGGTMTTAGNLVFYGDFEGVFKAVDATTGKVLWNKHLGSGIGAAPMTYKVNGKQYVAVVVGRSKVLIGFLGDLGKEMGAATPQGGMLYVFSQ
jgi:alcohol dehydrogenase (cytochrome c)